MNLYYRSGSIKEFIVPDAAVDYDREMIIKYLSQPFSKAGCPRAGIDCVTGKEISPSFHLVNDGKYIWGDFLIYHIRNYPVRLPLDFVEHVRQNSIKR